jgi:Flp pilus assembly protein TadD
MTSSCLERLHSVAAEHLRRGRDGQAIAALSRLALALPSGHPAAPTVHAALAFAQRRLGRNDRARSIERRVLELSRDASAGRRLVRAAREGSLRAPRVS